MPASERALRNLGEDITNAQRRLNNARRDGSATQILFWQARVNELLERYPTSEGKQPAMEDV